jgi:hypothetical protein
VASLLDVFAGSNLHNRFFRGYKMSSVWLSVLLPALFRDVKISNSMVDQLFQMQFTDFFTLLHFIFAAGPSREFALFSPALDFQSSAVVFLSGRPIRKDSAALDVLGFDRLQTFVREIFCLY